MRILLMGDASNYHRSLSAGLREAGCEVVVASDGGGFMHTGRDIDLSRRLPGRLGGMELWARLHLGLAPKLRGFDVVSIASQSFVSLKPSRQRAIFDRLRRTNRSVFLTALAADPHYVATCLSPDCPLPYSEYMIGREPAPFLRENPGGARAWTTPEMMQLSRHIYASVSGAVSALYEYHTILQTAISPSLTAYAGIPIDMRSVTPVEMEERPRKVRLFLGRHRHRIVEKGTDIIEAAARSVVEAHPGKAELVIVENRPYDEYVALQRSSHIVLDQLYSLSPGTNALLAMAQGLCTLSGADESFYRFIGETELRPVIHVEPDYESVRAALTEAVSHPDRLKARGLAGRDFVSRHNDSRTVASRFIDFWSSRLR